jgi:hypothetical protein
MSGEKTRLQIENPETDEVGLVAAPMEITISRN